MAKKGHGKPDAANTPSMAEKYMSILRQEESGASDSAASAHQ
jgi:hypothetical protein